MKTKTAEERKEQTETLLELYRNSDLLNGILVKHPQDAVQIQNEVIELMRLAIYTSPSQLPASVPTDWWDDERFIELKNAHLDIICKGILEYNGTGKFGSPELQKIADIVHRSLNHPPVVGEGEKCDYVIPKPKDPYDKLDKNICRDCNRTIAHQANT